MEYTKGEWRAEERGVIIVRAYDTNTEWTRAICYLPQRGERNKSENRANAHLIAASPDMYAALRKIVTMGFSHLRQDDIDKAKQAVDKAESKGF